MSDSQKIESAQLVVAEVLLDDALDRPLDYQIPESLIGKIIKGMRVKVPVRTSLRQGTVIGLKDKSLFKKLASIQEILLEKKEISDELFKLAEWMAYYYCCPLRKVLKTFLPPSVRGKAKVKEQLFIKLGCSANEAVSICLELRKSNPQQALVLDAILQAPKGMLLSKLIEKSGVSTAPIRSLVKKGVLIEQTTQIDRTLLMHAEYLPTKAKTLNGEQLETLDLIQESLDGNRFEVRLIHGITGSGKTEIYLQAIEHALQLKKGVIFLVPEIALTSQMIEKLKGRFQEKIAILHSKLSQGERFDAWHKMREGLIHIAIGARSAIFSPIQQLGLIIVDEEQEGSYKQTDEAPAYNARDVAVMRGKLTSASVLLGSATPSMESYNNAQKHKYKLSQLTHRADSATLPEVTIIDMKEENKQNKGFTLFSSLLINQIKQRLEVGEQVILFLNRRGYHTAQLCTDCGHTLQCPHCDVNLTFHLGDNILACHLCDYRLKPPPRICPGCKKEGSLKFKGVGTEMVERSLHALLPEVRTLRLDADTTRHKGSHELLFKQFRSGKADVLIGTQMIAKGLHFPQVTLVAVLNADGALQVPDFRASENTFQLLTQVAGRSGRGLLKGEVILQTFLPDHPIMALAKTQDYEAFFAKEIAIRELFHYPPFTHLVKLIFTGENPALVEQEATQMHQWLTQQLPPSFELLPVVPCGHAKIKNQFRFQFLLKAERIAPLLNLLNQRELERGPVRFLIDVDPLSTFF